MISYEAVESGARVLIEDGRYGIPWEDASEDDRAEVLTRVRAILEAAAPHIQAVAWDEGMMYGTRGQIRYQEDSDANPYKDAL